MICTVCKLEAAAEGSQQILVSRKQHKVVLKHLEGQKYGTTAAAPPAAPRDIRGERRRKNPLSEETAAEREEVRDKPLSWALRK
jgi:hypothetical protein